MIPILIRVRTAAACRVCGQDTDEAVLHNHASQTCHHAHLEGLPLAHRFDLFGWPGDLLVRGPQEVVERPALLVREAA